MKITFLGAAGEVTGSQHLIETSHRRILLDCGFFQGPRAESRRKNETFHCDPKSLDAVVLSHAHIDHCGNLPRLYRQGFRGPVFSTDATADIAEIMLLDSAKIQEEDAVYLTRKLRGNHPPIEPLYTSEDVERLMKKFEPCGFEEWHSLADDDEVRIRFTPAGHILGSAITELEVRDQGETKRIVFTGDLGRRDMPLLRDPVPVTSGADVLICESTYGSRVHPPPQDLKSQLLEILTEAEAKGGRVIIPAFALGRTQQVVYFLNDLFNEGVLPRIPVFVDSPLANRVTKIFRRYDHTLDADVQEVLKDDPDPFGFSHLTYVRNQRESMELNNREGAFVVIAASGMCEGGRVVHHLKHGITREENTVVLMGYQAPHTTGRRIADREPYIRLFGREHPLKAKVLQLEGLSAHADVTDLKWWFEESTRESHFGHVFLVHGEPDSATSLASVIHDQCDTDPVIPKYRESFEV
ncbi:MAG: MBL fold metallo-hydrolase [Planctomycetaceae bacterium]|nr:MBL fold metallo-hydrolase [Planctomycetaceae bacterium]